MNSMSSMMEEEDDFAPRLRPEVSMIAVTYGFIDPSAVDYLVEELAIGNDEPEAVLPEDRADPTDPLIATHFAFFEMAGSMFMLPGARDRTEHVTVSMLASTLNNARVDQLGRIRDAVNRSIADLNVADVRISPADPRSALLIAKMGSAGQFWVDWNNEAPTGTFITTGDGLVPEPGTAVAFIVDCLNAAACRYSNEEIRDALPAMMASLETSAIENMEEIDALA